MKHKKLYLPVLIAVLLAISMCPSNAFSKDGSITWQSYKDGIAMMKNQNKKGFIHFYTSWCTYCKLMNRNTFADAKVIAYLNKNFIPIRVNAEKERDVARQYGVNRFPTNWFLAEDSSSIGQRPGYIPPDILLDMLKYVNTNSFKKMSFNDYMQKKSAKN